MRRTSVQVVDADAGSIATGAAARKLPIQGLQQYWNNGISACAVCDGSSPLFRCGPASQALFTRVGMRCRCDSKRGVPRCAECDGRYRSHVE